MEKSIWLILMSTTHNKCFHRRTGNDTRPSDNTVIQKFRECFVYHICDVKNSKLGHDLPISVNDRVIAGNCEDFIFTKLRI